MLPGKIFVYDNFELVGESFPIIFLPEGADEIKIPITINQEQPDPPGPVPPGPVPPGPNPPEPVPPVPPAPGPTPVDPGTNIPQTGDTAPLAPIAALAVIAVLGCGFAIRKEF